MTDFWLRVYAVSMLAFGEALCIYSEMLIAKYHEPRWSHWAWTFFLITLAGIPLLLGYHYGYKAFGNMWAVMVVSVTSILLVEPMTIWLMFREVPSGLTIVSMTLGAAGLAVAMYE